MSGPDPDAEAREADRVGRREVERGAPGALDAAGSSSAVPGLLSHRADPAPAPPSLRDAEEIASLHLEWARLAGGEQGAATEESGAADVVSGPRSGAGVRSRGSTGGGGVGAVTGVAESVRAKVRARVVAAARADAAADRALIGGLIRAVDTVAARVDEVAARVVSLELLVQEVLDSLSEDLVRVQAALGTLDDKTDAQPRARPAER